MKLDPVLESSILAHYRLGETQPGSVLLFRALEERLRRYFLCKIHYYPGSDEYAEELAQETLVRVHLALISERRQADPIQSLPSFAAICARRALADWWSKHPPEAFQTSSVLMEEGGGASGEASLPLQGGEVPALPHGDFAPPDITLERKQRQQAVERCLERLPNPRHRGCLVNWLLGISLRELAQRYGYRDTNGPTSAKDAAKQLLIRCLTDLGFTVEFA